LVTSSILCECEKIYTGQNDCSTETEANDWHTTPSSIIQKKLAAVAEHINLGHVPC
jgi:hypothetical protein